MDYFIIIKSFFPKVNNIANVGNTGPAHIHKGSISSPPKSPPLFFLFQSLVFPWMANRNSYLSLRKFILKLWKGRGQKAKFYETDSRNKAWNSLPKSPPKLNCIAKKPKHTNDDFQMSFQTWGKRVIPLNALGCSDRGHLQKPPKALTMNILRYSVGADYGLLSI